MPIRRNYNGLEIDMLNVGKADCILVSRWSNGRVARVLIDGGEKHHATQVKRFLSRRGALDIDHVVCSHLHTDHAAGLIELIKDEDLDFGCAWVHRPEENVDVEALETINEALTDRTMRRASQFLLESLETQQTLVDCLETRGI